MSASIFEKKSQLRDVCESPVLINFAICEPLFLLEPSSTETTEIQSCFFETWVRKSLAVPPELCETIIHSEGSIDCLVMDSTSAGKNSVSFLLGVTTTWLNFPLLAIMSVDPRHAYV